MIAIDTNILVYAHRRDSAFHQPAAECVRQAAEGASTWAIPWPCVHEFLAVVTSPKVFKVPTPLPAALAQIHAWRESSTLRFLAEEAGYFEVFEGLVRTARIVGPKIHDARIAALALFHGAVELLTADRDFSRFATLEVRNPLQEK